MERYVSMLRGVNVAGQKPMRMEALREACSSAGLRAVRTYLNSGNVVFEHPPARATELERMLTEVLGERFGYRVTVIVRSGEELRSVVDAMPFAGKDQEKIHVTFLSRPPDSFPREKVDAARRDAEGYSLRGREVYLFCPYGYGTTKLSNGFFERVLGVSATTRNWRTVNALLGMSSLP